MLHFAEIEERVVEINQESQTGCCCYLIGLDFSGWSDCFFHGSCNHKERASRQASKQTTRGRSRLNFDM